MKRIIYIALIACMMCNCNDSIDIQQSYDFKVTHLPVPKRLKMGETAEIRCQIEREGEYTETYYSLRYFQPDGKGELKLDDGIVFLLNDLYRLSNETFRLYYTSQSEDQQVIDIYFFDNLGKSYTLSFAFNNENLEVKEM